MQGSSESSAASADSPTSDSSMSRLVMMESEDEVSGLTVVRVGDYVLGEMLGEGGFATVHLGSLGDDVDASEERPARVALKIVRTEWLKKTKKNSTGARTGDVLSEQKARKKARSARKQFEREVEALQRVTHPNVIRMLSMDWCVKLPAGAREASAEVGLDDSAVLDVSQEPEEVAVLTLELAENGEVMDFLSYTQRFGEKVARTYFQQLVSGLKACHDAGVAHRDIKPANILLDADFNAKLADFGMSALFNDRPAQTRCGTTSYMAPEVFIRSGYDPFQADVWSLGIVLFIMVAGFPPLETPTSSDWWFDKLLRGKTQLFWRAHCRSVAFSKEFRSLIEGMLNPDPRDRLSVAAIQEHPWLQGEQPTAGDLAAEFLKRRAIIDEELARKRLQRAEARESGDADAGAVRQDVVRELTEDGLPVGAPRVLSVEAEIDEEEDDATELEPRTRQNSAPALPSTPPAPTAEAVRCYTSVYSSWSGDELLHRVSGVLERLGAKSVAVDRKRFGLVADVVTTEGPVKLALKVYQVDSDMRYATFQRLKGDFFHFKNLSEDAFVCLAQDGGVALPRAATAADP